MPNKLDSIHISLTGTATKIRFSIQFETTLKSDKDWVLTARASRDEEPLNYSALNWSYSSSLDRNFVYAPSIESGKLFAAPALITETPFDEIELALHPWSKVAQNMQSKPSILAVNYVTQQEHLLGIGTEDRVNVFGSVQPLRNSQ